VPHGIFGKDTRLARNDRGFPQPVVRGPIHSLASLDCSACYNSSYRGGRTSVRHRVSGAAASPRKHVWPAFRSRQSPS
jgi:hypothetical protein